MASQTKTESTTSVARAAERLPGVLPNVVHLALDVADKSQSTVIAVLHDARTELRSALDQGLDYAEKLATSALRFARKTVARVDEGTAETLTGVERVLGGAVKSARETTRAAAELAQTTAACVTGNAAAA